MVAQAFLHKPALVLIDEPLINLDPIMQRKIKNYLADYVKGGGTVFLSTHILEIAEEICTRIGIIHQGNLVREGPVAGREVLVEAPRGGLPRRHPWGDPCLRSLRRSPSGIFSKRVPANTIFTAMLKEEWRIHSTLFGSVGFALFPLLLVFFAFAGALFWPFFSDVLPAQTAVILIHSCYLLAGASVGGFGLFGREVMNRRFGQASLIAYSSRSLPVSEQSILLNFFLKDTVYYLVFWVFPFVAGLAFAAPFVGIPVTSAVRMLATLSLSFLLGLSLAFILSTIYVHSPRVLLGILVVAAAGAALTVRSVNAGVISLLPSLGLYHPAVGPPSPRHPPPHHRALRHLGAVPEGGVQGGDEALSRDPGPAGGVIRLVTRCPPHRKGCPRPEPERGRGREGRLLLPLPCHVHLDRALHPPAVHPDALPDHGLRHPPRGYLLHHLQLGHRVRSLHLLCLPARRGSGRSSVGSSRVTGSSTWSRSPSSSRQAFGTGQPALLIPALLTFASISFYAVAVTVYVGGLSPSVMLYNAKVYLPYLGLIIPVLLVILFVSIPNPWFALVSLCLIPPGWYILRKAFARWTAWEQPSF